MTAGIFLFLMVVCHQPYCEIRKIPLGRIIQLVSKFGNFIETFLKGLNIPSTITNTNTWIPDIIPAWEKKNEINDW